jgi:hypothetical protein
VVKSKIHMLRDNLDVTAETQYHTDSRHHLRTKQKILSKYTRQTDPDLLDRTYKQALETVNRDPATPREANTSTARLMADLNLVDRAAVHGSSVESFYDNSYVDEIKQSVFYKDLWR